MRNGKEKPTLLLMERLQRPQSKQRQAARAQTREPRVALRHNIGHLWDSSLSWWTRRGASGSQSRMLKRARCWCRRCRKEINLRCSSWAHGACG